MLKEIVERKSDVSLHVVWMPMVPGDDEAAARESARMFAGRNPDAGGGVCQYYDSGCVVGRAFAAEVFPTCLRDALAVTPADHPLRETLEEWARLQPGERPLWDAVLFYPAGVRWEEKAPAPAYWSKQVGYIPEGAPPGVTGVFFHDDCRLTPRESDWQLEVRGAIGRLSGG